MHLALWWLLKNIQKKTLNILSKIYICHINFSHNMQPINGYIWSFGHLLRSKGFDNLGILVFHLMII